MATLTERETNSRKKGPAKSRHIGFNQYFDPKDGTSDPNFPVIDRMVETLGKNSALGEALLTALLDTVDAEGSEKLLARIKAGGSIVEVSISTPTPEVKEPKGKSK